MPIFNRACSVTDYGKKSSNEGSDTSIPNGKKVAKAIQSGKNIPVRDTFVRSETTEQIQFANWMNSTYPDILWTASCAGMRTSFSQAKKMKAMGAKRGVPDIMIFASCGSQKGLFLELKRERGGVVSPEQTNWIKRLNELGYSATVCKGADEARRAVESYFCSGGN